MNEQSMECRYCVLKHLAGAISYAKEILDGHGKGGTPDHRPDYLGELVNAEHHLELVSKEILEKVSAMRTAAQMKGMTPSEEDIEELRMLWVEVEDLEEGKPQAKGEEVPTDRYPGLADMKRIGVLLDEAWYREENKEKLEVFLKLMVAHAENDGIIHIGDLADYGDPWMWVFPLGVFIANDADMLKPVSAGVSSGRRPSFMMRLVNVKQFNIIRTVNPGFSAVDIIDRMDFSGGVLKEEAVMPVVERKPCCSLKRRIMTEPFVKVTDKGWPYMREIWRGR